MTFCFSPKDLLFKTPKRLAFTVWNIIPGLLYLIVSCIRGENIRYIGKSILQDLTSTQRNTVRKVWVDFTVCDVYIGIRATVYFLF